MSLFEKASRLKLRFDTPNGQLAVEDLWGLPLQSQNPAKANLNDIARGLSKLVRESGEENFVDEAAPKNERVELAFEIVKHMITVKKEENKAKETAEENRKTRARIATILEERRDKAFESKSDDELNALFQKLSG